jgi:hypothetical protein
MTLTPVIQVDGFHGSPSGSLRRVSVFATDQHGHRRPTESRSAKRLALGAARWFGSSGVFQTEAEEGMGRREAAVGGEVDVLFRFARDGVVVGQLLAIAV